MIVRTVVWLEILGGIAALAISAWSLSGLWTCQAGTGECESWAYLGAFIFTPVGVCLIGSGFWVSRSKSIWSQVPAVAGIVWLIGWVVIAS